MTDEAEKWLRDHDPDYATSRNAWRHIRDGRYKTPAQEIPWGLSANLRVLVNSGGGRFVQPLEERACELCGQTFLPRETRQRFCSEKHRKVMENRRLRGSA